jgi:hypothetical protein
MKKKEIEERKTLREEKKLTIRKNIGKEYITKKRHRAYGQRVI